MAIFLTNTWWPFFSLILVTIFLTNNWWQCSIIHPYKTMPFAGLSCFCLFLFTVIGFMNVFNISNTFTGYSLTYHQWATKNHSFNGLIHSVLGLCLPKHLHKTWAYAQFWHLNINLLWNKRKTKNCVSDIFSHCIESLFLFFRHAEVTVEE